MNEAKPVHYLFLALCLAGAFALRYPGIRFGFPLFLHPDEPQITEPAMRRAATGEADPQTFVYPSLPIYTQAAVYRLGYGLGVLRRTFDDYSEVPALTLHFWGRLATIVFSLAVIWLVWRSASTLSGPIAGLVAALLAATSLLQVQSSFSINADIPLSLWALAAYLAALSVVADGPRTAAYLSAGIFAGLAMGTKYIGVFTLLPLAAAHFLRPGFKLGRLIDGNFYRAVVIAGLVFAATTPFALREGGALLEALGAHRAAYGLEPATVAAAGGDQVLTAAAQASSYPAYGSVLMEKFGPIPLALAAVGLIAMLFSSWSATAVTAAFPLAWFAAIGAAPVYFEHNMVCVVPFLAIFAGTGVATILELGGEKLGPLPRRLRTVAVGVPLALGLYSQVKADLAYTTEITLRDTRGISKEWIEQNLQPGTRIAREAYTPPIDADRFKVTELGLGGLARARDLPRYDYLVASSTNFAPFLAQPQRYPQRAARYQDIFKAFPLVASFTADGESTSGPSVFIYRTQR